MTDSKFPSSWELITPERAADILVKNENNRPLNFRVVENIAARMEAGTWIETHQGIGIDVNGNLLDGQHRLAAIVKANKPFSYLVTTGLPPAVFEHTDVGGRGVRTAADFLHRALPDLPHKLLLCGVSLAAMKGLRPASYDKTEQVKFIQAHREMMLQLTETLMTQTVVRRASVIGAFVNAARTKDDEFPGPKGGYPLAQVMEKATALAHLQFVGDDDPLKALFNRLLKERQLGGNHHTRGEFVYGLTVGSLRASLMGRKLTRAEATSIDWDGSRAATRKEQRRETTVSPDVRLSVDGKRKSLYDLLRSEGNYQNPANTWVGLLQQRPLFALLSRTDTLQAVVRNNHTVPSQVGPTVDDAGWEEIKAYLLQRTNSRGSADASS